jgi:hypothetical protein
MRADGSPVERLTRVIAARGYHPRVGWGWDQRRSQAVATRLRFRMGKPENA